MPRQYFWPRACYMLVYFALHLLPFVAYLAIVEVYDELLDMQLINVGTGLAVVGFLIGLFYYDQKENLLITNVSMLILYCTGFLYSITALAAVEHAVGVFFVIISVISFIAMIFYYAVHEINQKLANYNKFFEV